MYSRRSVIKCCVAVLLFAALLRLFLGLELPSVLNLRPSGSDPLRLYGRQPDLLRFPGGYGLQKPPSTTGTHPSSPQTTVPSRPPSTGLPTLPETAPPVTAPPLPTLPPTAAAQPLSPPLFLQPAFTESDREYVKLQYEAGCTHRPDLYSLLESPLEIDLTGQEPTVLILHSHGTECYTRVPGESYEESGTYRTEDTAYNMISIGDTLTQILEGAGISVLHDRTMHDQNSYSNAYHSSRSSIESYLQQYPSIRLVLDLHRDAATYPDGSQFAPTITVDGQETAQILFVMGTDLAASNPYWQENLALALKMQVLLEKQTPGLTRGTILRTSRYNQDLIDGAMLIEFGTAGNTHAQVLAAVPLVAKAILALQKGTL